MARSSDGFEDFPDLGDLGDLEDLDLLDEFQDEPDEPPKKKAKKSKKKPSKDSKGGFGVKKIVASVAALGVLGIAGYSYMSGGLTTTDPQPSEVTTTADAPTERAILPLVNLEQVSFADRMCFYMGESEWLNSLHTMPNYNEEQSPQKIREDMINVLNRNANRIEFRAAEVAKIPDLAHTDAQEQMQNVMVVDNIKKVAPDIDPKVVAASQQLSFAFSNYSESVRAMAQELENIATYDGNGIRASLSRIQNSVDVINEQFINEAALSFNMANFDNYTTVMQAAESEYCAGILVNDADLSDEEKSHIQDEKIITDAATYDRCEEFVKNTSAMTAISDSLRSNIDACNNILTTVSVDRGSNLLSLGIDTQDAARAVPNVDRGLLSGRAPASTSSATASSVPSSTTVPAE